MSLERKLPVLMTAVAAVVLASTLYLTHRTLTRTEERAASERLERAAAQVATIVGNSVAFRTAAVEPWGRNAGVRGILRGELTDSAAVRSALAALIPLGDSTLALELHDAEGRRVASLGPEAGDSAIRLIPIELPFAEIAAGLADSTSGDVRYGPLHRVGDRIYFWVTVPVMDGERAVGFVSQRRRVGGAPEVSETMTDLIGQDVVFYLRNAVGEGWVRSPGDPAEAPQRRDTTGTGIVHVRPDIGGALVGEAHVAATPWIVVLETPLDVVHAMPHETLWQLSLLGLVLLALGALASWVISRRITEPLVSLTTAAEAIARGEYDRRVRVDGDEEVARLATAFNQMAGEVAGSRAELEQRIAEAERANRAKSDFLAVMSHELRTPLNAIGGYAQLLELGVHGPLTPAQLDALSRLSRSQAHLLALINDVLNFARIDAGQLSYAVTDVPLADTLVMLEPLIAPQVAARGLSFVAHPCPPEMTVRADRDKLLQVLLNLLTNAIKFTDPGGRLELACEMAGDEVRLHVHDTGIGIPADRLDSIFEPFVQLDRALSRPHEGVGLGLAISRDLARGMGGDLTVTSEAGRGSTFTITLPAGAPAPGATASRPARDDGDGRAPRGAFAGGS